ncbi:alpha/beta hydrolase [Pseudonocardiaceae bacterium YIM PH 21723]|nr:alpha/beta hydrolase [Pseudonocardiaceae bacterium YIM PH 21723]
MTKSARVLGAAITGVMLVLWFVGPLQRTIIDTGTTSTKRVIKWDVCDEQAENVQCGELVLPVDWAHPDGQLFRMAFARHRATDPAHRIGTLLINFGGPGVSGVSMTQDPGFGPDIAARFDIVGFDPRGTNSSHPVLCRSTLVADLSLEPPQDAAAFNALAKGNQTLNADCSRHTGAVFALTDSTSVAHDMEALRVALGEETVSYYGVSYGTLIGQEYARMYGSHLRAMALDSVLNHEVDVRALMTQGAAAVEDSFNQFAGWCARTPACALHEQPVGGVFDRFLALAEQGRLHDPNTDARLTAFQLINHAYGSLASPSWAELASWLAGLQDSQPVEAEAAQPSAPSTLIENDLQSVICADWNLKVPDFTAWQNLQAAARSAAPHMRMNPEMADWVLRCIGSTARTPNPQHPVSVPDGTPKVLLVNSQHDPVTNIGWARRVRDQIGGRATLLSYDGWGHEAYFRSSCVRDRVDAYLVEVASPAPGVTCPAVDPE